MAAEKAPLDVKAARQSDHHALMKALKTKDYSGAATIVRRGGYVESLREKSETPLMYAVKNRGKDFVQLLLNAGANPEAVDANGQTALSHAVFMRKDRVAEILLRKGASVNTAAKNNNTPLMIAVMRDYISTINLLLYAGADMEVKGPGGKTVLLLAAEGRNMKVLQMLIQRGASLTAVDDNGASALVTALVSAVRFPNDDVAKILLDLHAHVDASSRYEAYIKKIENRYRPYRLSPLEEALASPKTNCKIKPLVEYLVGCGVSVNAPVIDPQNSTVRTGGCDAKTESILPMLRRFELKGTDIVVKYLFPQFFDEGACDTMPLTLSVKLGDMDIVRLFLGRGARVDLVDTNRKTALVTALNLSKAEMAKLLVEHGASVNVSDIYGQTPLMFAMKSCETDMIKLLIERGACINARDKNGVTPLLIAVGDMGIRMRPDIVELLVERGASINATDIDGNTPLLEALKCNKTETAKLLLRHGASVNGSDMNGKTPLMNALQYCSTGMVKLLLDRDASINATDKDGATPLLFVLTNGDKSDFNLSEKVSLLLQHGACVNMGNVQRKTPLMNAAKGYPMKVMSLLLDHDAHVNTADVKGETPLMAAAECGDIKVMKMLLERGACVNVKDIDGNTPVTISVRHRAVQKLQLLLDHGASVNTVDVKGQTPLISAAKTSNSEMITLLVGSGASVDAIDNDGKSLLILAAESGQVHTIQHILEAGTNTINLADSEGYTAMLRSIVKLSKYQTSSVVKMLVKYGCDVNTKTNDGDTALILAAKRQDLSCMEILMENGFVKVDSRDSTGYTALMHLLRENLDTDSKTYIFKLLQRGANVNTVAQDGQSPLTLALDHSYSNYFPFLIKTDSELIINSLFDYGADMSLSSQAYKYLNRMICDKKNAIVQKMILNGCPPICSPCSIFRDQPVEPRSALEVALLSSNISAFKYILEKRFFTSTDVNHLSDSFETVLNKFLVFCQNPSRREIYTAQVKSVVQDLSEPPISLFTLSFVAVSSALGLMGKPSASCGGADRPITASHLEDVQKLPHTSSVDKHNMARPDHPQSPNTVSESNNQSKAEAEAETKVCPNSKDINARKLVHDTNPSCSTKPTVTEEKAHEAWNPDKTMSRQEKVELLPVPISLKKALLFQECCSAQSELPHILLDDDGSDNDDIQYREKNHIEQRFSSDSDSSIDSGYL